MHARLARLGAHTYAGHTTTHTRPPPPRVAGFPSLGTHLHMLSLCQSSVCLSHYPMHVSAPRGVPEEIPV